jgi:hypothetical protein
MGSRYIDAKRKWSEKAVIQVYYGFELCVRRSRGVSTGENCSVFDPALDEEQSPSEAHL